MIHRNLVLKIQNKYIALIMEVSNWLCVILLTKTEHSISSKHVIFLSFSNSLTALKTYPEEIEEDKIWGNNLMISKESTRPTMQKLIQSWCAVHFCIIEIKFSKL